MTPVLWILAGVTVWMVFAFVVAFFVGGACRLGEQTVVRRSFRDWEADEVDDIWREAA